MTVRASSRAIWKFHVPMDGFWHDVEVPAGATIVDVEGQGQDLYFWALCDPDAARETRRLGWVGTGHHITDGEYRGTVHKDGFVWHLIEEQVRVTRLTLERLDEIEAGWKWWGGEDIPALVSEVRAAWKEIEHLKKTVAEAARVISDFSKAGP